MRWIIDTSAWSHRGRPEVAKQIEDLLAENDQSELVLASSVELEILRDPQGAGAAELRAEIEDSMDVLETTPRR
jgi:predicted nucleic acid-binding protein